jgi:hypothetical protein
MMVERFADEWLDGVASEEEDASGLMAKPKERWIKLEDGRLVPYEADGAVDVAINELGATVADAALIDDGGDP